MSMIFIFAIIGVCFLSQVHLESYCEWALHNFPLVTLVTLFACNWFEARARKLEEDRKHNKGQFGNLASYTG